MKLFVLFFFTFLWTIFIVQCQEDTLVNKIQQLTELSLKKPVIRFNNERFNHFVKTAPRNYSMIVMFTALSPQRQCGMCKDAHDEYETVAKSYRYSNAFSNKVFFGMVDFDEGAEVFQNLKLNTAPVFIHFPPKMKPKKTDYMDLNRRGFAAEQIAKWVQDRTAIPIEIYRPPNYSNILLAAAVVLILGGLLYSKRNSLHLLYNQLLWGIIVIFVILTCISGQIWNRIRSPAFVHRDSKTGQTGFFSGGTGYQFVAETYIVFLLYFGVAVGVILLNEAPRIKSKAGKRRTMVAILGILMVIFLFSYLLSVFRAKYQGYPYSFLIK